MRRDAHIRCGLERSRGCVGGPLNQLWPLALPIAVTTFAFFVRRDKCSGSDCGKHLPAGAMICQSCGGQVVGRIARLAQRDEAERRFLATDDELSEQARTLARELLRRD